MRKEVTANNVISSTTLALIVRHNYTPARARDIFKGSLLLMSDDEIQSAVDAHIVARDQLHNNARAKNWNDMSAKERDHAIREANAMGKNSSVLASERRTNSGVVRKWCARRDLTLPSPLRPRGSSQWGYTGLSHPKKYTQRIR